MSNNNFRKYLAYAIGEIILVVIGILIALSINNWSENRKSQIQLNTIYDEIEQNLRSDLSNLEEVIREYEELAVRLDEIITSNNSGIPLESINASNYLEILPNVSDINSFIAFDIHDKGIGLLRSFNDVNTNGNTDLSSEIIQFYTINESLNLVLDKLNEESFNNIKYFEQFSWYADYMNAEYNAEAVDFFAKNTMFKNKVVTYRLIAVQNYLPRLIYYKESATALLEDIAAASKN